MPSCTRAPPESLMKMNGLPVCSASSITSATLWRVDLAGRAAQDREVLAGKVDEAAVDRRRAGDHAVGGNFLAGHAEVGLPVLGEEADLLEAAGIDQGVDALASGELSLLPLLGLPVGATPLLEFCSLGAEVFDQVLHRSSSWRSSADSFLSRLDAGCTVTLCDFSPTRIS